MRGRIQAVKIHLQSNEQRGHGPRFCATTTRFRRMTEYVQLKSFRVQLTQDGWQESNFCDIFISTPKKVRLQ